MAVDTLLASHIYEDLSEEGFKRALKTNITSGAKYFYDEGYCTVYLNQKIFPYFFELSKKFTTQNLFYVARLPDVNLANFYQVIMKRYSKSNKKLEWKTVFTIGVDDLKDEMWLFRLDKKNNKEYLYKNFKDFGQLLKKLSKNLSERTNVKNIVVEIEERKARKAKTLRISYIVTKEHIPSFDFSDEKLDEIERNIGLFN